MPTPHVPSYARAILHRLTAAGYPAYLVGGCVRDLQLNRRPKDWDICTAALPEEIMNLFPRTRPTGLRHGTVTVYWGNGRAEVTTFRTESNYSDHRRPDKVFFVSDLETDLARRDFTINSMALDQNGRLHDPFDGMTDLISGQIRTVGTAERRFREDALRMFRAFRFSARLGFSIVPETLDAIRALAPTAALLAPERIATELTELLEGPGPDRFWDIGNIGLLEHIFPGISSLPHPVNSLCKIPKRHRWTACIARLYTCGYCPVPKDGLHALRLPTTQVQIASRAAVLAATPPKDRLAWKHCIAKYGYDIAVSCAWACQFLGHSGNLAQLREICRSGECVSRQDLQVNGRDLAVFGLEGKAIGAALDKLLHHVLLHPQDNQRERLLSMLELSNDYSET